ncbi:helix-turn-helix domain-containing protein [Clostridium sp.]|uniref:PucR family transcriptional regulator n=1 Tax=Clostridium sp. TaxID=1506 RepID=UPI00262AD60F|nr:helix-turn-helix domain-containing protein [Clostridium sp.]
MREIYTILKDISDKSDVKLRLLDENNNEIFDNLPPSESKVKRKIEVNDLDYKIFLEQDDIKIIPLVEYILNKGTSTENIIEDLLKGKRQWESLENSPITKSNKILLIETKKENEALSIINETYINDDIFVGEIYDRIIVIGNLEEEEEHALSIKETLIQNLGVNARISIGDLNKTFEGFKNCYEGMVRSLEMGKRFNIKPEIYSIKNMFLEQVIYNFDKDYSKELKEEYKDIFKGFNHELIQTLEEIIKSNLSLTKAAKKLYIHRNTLMYRVEKIKKETGFDIRNFKDAIFLYIIYMNSKN